MDSEVCDRNVAKVDGVDIDHGSHLERAVTTKTDSCRSINAVTAREKPSTTQDSNQKRVLRLLIMSAICLTAVSPGEMGQFLRYIPLRRHNGGVPSGLCFYRL